MLDGESFADAHAQAFGQHFRAPWEPEFGFHQFLFNSMIDARVGTRFLGSRYVEYGPLHEVIGAIMTVGAVISSQSPFEPLELMKLTVPSSVEDTQEVWALASTMSLGLMVAGVDLFQTDQATLAMLYQVSTYQQLGIDMIREPNETRDARGKKVDFPEEMPRYEVEAAIQFNVGLVMGRSMPDLISAHGSLQPPEARRDEILETGRAWADDTRPDLAYLFE